MRSDQAVKAVPSLKAGDFIEPLFFAYRDFVGDADIILDRYGFGRAHHRILHFVGTRPALTIAELLNILKITKQSLNRVLKELIGLGFITAMTGESDRRQRHLYLTDKGKELAQELINVQIRRIERALSVSGMQDAVHAHRFLIAMADQ